MKEKQRIYILFILYLLLNVVLLIFHEPWRDEAQSWLMTRDLSLFEIPIQMRYEGHPCLWHLIVFMFSHFGFPYLTQNVVSILFVSIAVFIFITKTDFGLLFKAIVIFSPLFTWHYPVISRSYCLIPFFIALLAYYYEKRHEKSFFYCILIALFVQVHVAVLGFAFALSLVLLIEIIKKCIEKNHFNLKLFLPLFLPAVSAVLLGLQIFTGIDDRVEVEIKPFTFLDLFKNITATISGMLQKTFKINLSYGIWILCLLLLVSLILTIVKRHNNGEKKEYYYIYFVVIFSVVFQIVFYANVYEYTMQRIYVMPLMMFWGLWVLKKKNMLAEYKKIDSATVFAGCLLLCLVLTSKDYLYSDLRYQYSDSRNAARFIKENIMIQDDNPIFLSDNRPYSCAILPYLDKVDMRAVPSMESFSFVTWNKEWDMTCDYDEFIRIVSELSNEERPVYLINCYTNSFINDNEYLEYDFEKLYETSELSIKDENYKIYKIN